MKRNIVRKSGDMRFLSRIVQFINRSSFQSAHFKPYSFIIPGLLLLICFVWSCEPGEKKLPVSIPEKGIAPVKSDELILAEGLTYDVMITGLDTIGENSLFGYDASGLLYVSTGKKESALWVNHELMSPMLASGYYGDMARLRNQITKERQGVGTTVLSVFRENNNWNYHTEGLINYRIKGDDAIDMQPAIKGFSKAQGTIANGPMIKTSNNTVVTAESGYEAYVGDINYETGRYQPSVMKWEAFTKGSPYHYGWIVETDIATKKSRKLTNIGRISRGGIAIAKRERKQILYFTDKSVGGCLYKYVSETSDKLDKGTLYVASLTTN
ncbi:MAG: alkaline phosphatase PhoX, partial [Cyclobacteriaceae bacterium]